MRTLISMVPLLSGCLLTDEQYEIKYEEFFADSVEADTADSADVAEFTLQTVTLSSDTMFTNSTLTATAEAINTSDEMVDITDQQVTFEWHVIDADTNQDTVVQTDQSNTLDGTLYFDKDDQVYAVATFGAESVTSDTILVYNSPPTTPSINITPNSPVAGQDDVSCNVTVESTDADNDPVTYNYEWLDSTGETIQRSIGVAELSDVLSAELTTEGPLTCSVTPLSVDYVGISEFAIVDVEAAECSGMLFDNVDDVIGISDVSLPTEHTVEAWVYWYGNTTEIWQYIFEQNFSGGDSAMRFAIRNSDGLLRVETANNIGPTYALPANEWVLVSSTFSSATSTSTLYLNGTQVETVQLEHSPNVGDLSIGGLVENNQSSGYTFNGIIHSVRISDTVKYTQDFEPGTLSHENDTVGLWVLSDLDSSPVDQSGEQETGTLYGEPGFVDSCPEEDLDGDGYAASVDCDDTDALLHTERPVVSCYGNSIITVAADSLLEFGAEDKFTIDFWAYYTDSSEATLVKGDNTTFEYAVSGNATQIILVRQSYGGDLYVTETRTIENWTRYTVSYDAGAVQWYQNGQPTSSGNGTLGNASFSDLSICNHPTLGDPMNGMLANLMFFNAVLSPATVADMQDRTIDPLTDIPSLITHWPMDEGIGTTINDTVNQLSGEMSGAAWSTGCVPEAPETPAIDFDGDGYTATEDCNDNDPQINILGAMDYCPATSCLEILNSEAYPPGDGTYWLDPDGTGAFLAHCDMTTDGGGWTRIAYMPTASGGSVINTATSVNLSGCQLASAYCKFSDSAINAILSFGTGADDRFRMTNPNDVNSDGGQPGPGNYYWDTDTAFSYTNTDETSNWWKVATSYGGPHSTGCRHPEAYGVGHYSGGCYNQPGFGPFDSSEVNWYHYELQYGGSPNPNNAPFSWWAK